MKDSLITIIVPVYNVEEYLDRCIDSVMNQTYQNIEIILVDDGSVDRSGAICDSYAKKDSRITVIHKENGGLSDARNEALNIAKGEYFAFVDSDDYLADDYVEYLYELLIQNEADISACEIKKVYSDTEQLDECQENTEVISGRDALECFLYQRKVVPNAVCKLYKREIFNEIRYPKGMHYEDLATIYKVLGKCDRFVMGKKQKYYYYQRANSIMNDDFNEKKMHRIQIANEMKTYVDARYPELSNATSARCFLAAIQVYREIPKNRKYNGFRDEAWLQIVKWRGSVIKNHKAKLSIRVMALSTLGGKKLLIFLAEVYSFFVNKGRMIK